MWLSTSLSTGIIAVETQVVLLGGLQLLFPQWKEKGERTVP